ncbi:Glycosyl transferase CAP10 domain [Dillenia turbinata]|uniref:Glycosyl transferase CAP10 domain n=1 Tax=Dillenia turbinata TaxID=194707 RepID=A0AAN8UX09_9MAGN
MSENSMHGVHALAVDGVHMWKGFGKALNNFTKKGISTTIFVFFLLLLLGAFLFNRCIDTTIFTSTSLGKLISPISEDQESELSTTRPPENFEFPFNCTNLSIINQTSLNKSKSTTEAKKLSPVTCPEYFRWIHEDLRPWNHTGVSREMVEQAKDPAYVRILIVNGRVYVDKYRWVFQTRDVFTIWGLLQLLRLYPGQIPDVDFMFEMGDMPAISKSAHPVANDSAPPVMFHYCGDDKTHDIVFPDWSFWGWPEINIKPWNVLRYDLQDGNKRIKWKNREPFAYWKGNVYTGTIRRELRKCNISAKHDWKARIFEQDWGRESRRGYKIYAEGNSWSVSEKYILACDSMTLFLKLHFYDFFTRGLLPVKHYWPIKLKDMCSSIEYAVNWGNKHTKEAQKMGKEGAKFVQEKVKMKYVYDYMYHLLNEYAKLLKYKPTVPPKAVEYTVENMACNAHGLEQTYLKESMVHGPSDTQPCTLPPPFGPSALKAYSQKRENLTKLVEQWEAEGNVKRKINLGQIWGDSI